MYKKTIFPTATFRQGNSFNFMGNKITIPGCHLLFSSIFVHEMIYTPVNKSWIWGITGAMKLIN